MRISEKTLELTLCCQLVWLWRNGPQQPLWFGLTQKQEARAGFDAATRLRNRRILILQFKAGRRLKNDRVRFIAPHAQLNALQARKQNRRSIYYVLPEVTQTRELGNSSAWIIESTWFLDVVDIPILKAPSRRYNNHYMTLDPHTGIVEIASDPVNVQAIKAVKLFPRPDRPSIGYKYADFDNFWSYAKLFGKGAKGAALPLYEDRIPKTKIEILGEVFKKYGEENENKMEKA